MDTCGLYFLPKVNTGSHLNGKGLGLKQTTEVLLHVIKQPKMALFTFILLTTPLPRKDICVYFFHKESRLLHYPFVENEFLWTKKMATEYTLDRSE